MKWADTPRAAAQAGDLIFTMVTNTEALHAVTGGPDGILAGLSSGKIYIDMSTVSPAASRELARQVETKGAQMLDAPVSGSMSTLEEGKLSFMVGGRAQRSLRKRSPILQAIGPKVTYVGGNGLAVSMKIATNLSLAVQMLAFSEGVLLAEKSGIARETAVEVLLNSVMASPMVKYRGPFVLKMPDEAWFDVNMMQKDLLLALEMGRQLDVPLPTTAITNEMLTAARGMGLAEKDFAILFEVLARMAGMKTGDGMWNDGVLEIGMMGSETYHYSNIPVLQSASENLMAHPKQNRHQRNLRSTLSRDQALHFYRQMLKIRLFEEQVNQLYLGAKMPGLAHLYIGQEAVAVGVCEALRRDDYITSTHRGHGHCLAKGASVDKMFAELLGKAAGLLPRQGRLHAHRRSGYRQSRSERYRRRQRGHRHWCGHVGEDAWQRSSSSLFFRRGRAGARAALRSDEHGFALEATGHLRLRE